MLLHNHTDFTSFVGIVANDLGIRDVIIEKDYWVTYVLHELRSSVFKNSFIFKGGTSLSKGWNLIDRFSEDIDLLLVGNGLGGKNKRVLHKKIQRFVASLPGLSYDQHNINNRSGDESRTCCFRYESHLAGELGALLPYIKLEMGFRGGNEPTETRQIQSLIF